MTFIRPLAKVNFTPRTTSRCANNPPDAGGKILLPLRFGEGWGGVCRIYARGLLNIQNLNLL
ncbi:MAG TPA: hypothetical protein DCY91_08735 [Cyanobacteria bacterium UBA11370]|nr:hypothetical protein [Cyanobacteria bacterium UBA11370]